MAAPTPPKVPIQILFRSKEAVELFTLPDTSLSAAVLATSDTANNSSSTGGGGGVTLYKRKTTFHILNPNGQYVYLHDADVGLIKCDLSVCSSSSSSTSNANTTATPPFIPDSKSVQLAKCSPRGTYLLTWAKPSSSSNNNTNNNSIVENLRIYDATSGKFLHGFSCKKATLSTLQWTHDESLVFHLVSNEVHIYTANNDDTFQRVGKIRCPNIASFSLPSVKGFSTATATTTTSTETKNQEEQKKYLLTTFVSGSKGKPARVDLLRYPDRMGVESSSITTTSSLSSTNIEKLESSSASSGPGLASKSLFDAEEVTVQWSPRADAALVLTQTVVDATGESYYGSSHLFLLLENDVKRPGYGSAISVTLPAESTKSVHGSIPILCACWVPNPTIVGPVPFGVISGSMPPLASLHHGITAEPTFLFGRAHRNTMDISPHGRFIVCGGYGNLAGGMEFWDRHKGKVITRRIVLPSSTPESPMSYVTIKEASELSITSQNPAVGHQWSPDSRTYLVSTTSPRMNVDNGVHIYRYDGSLIDETRLPWDNAAYQPDKLLCAEYIPAPFPSTDVGKDDNGRDNTKEFYYYPDRPQSPPPRGSVELTGDAARLALATLASQNNSRTSTGKGGTTTGGGGSGAASYVPPGARKAGTTTTGGVLGGGGAYVPPGARKGTAGRIGGSTLAERMRQEREGNTSKVTGVKVTKRTGPVGASSVTSAASISGTVAGATGEKSKSALRREKQNLAKEKAEREAAEAEQRKKDEERALTEENKSDPEKRAKKIKKILKQIDEIKAKASSGCELNDDQKKKIASEGELMKELASLGI